jgi:hypothetical protein
MINEPGKGSIFFSLKLINLFKTPAYPVRHTVSHPEVQMWREILRSNPDLWLMGEE